MSSPRVCHPPRRFCASRRRHCLCTVSWWLPSSSCVLLRFFRSTSSSPGYLPPRTCLPHPRGLPSSLQTSLATGFPPHRAVSSPDLLPVGHPVPHGAAPASPVFVLCVPASPTPPQRPAVRSLGFFHAFIPAAHTDPHSLHPRQSSTSFSSGFWFVVVDLVR